MNILQFMRLQAASTRILNPLPKKASGVVGNTKLRNSARLIAARANSVRIALRGSIPATNKRAIHAANKKPVFHSRSLLARQTSDEVPVAASSFVAQEPFVQLVTSDQPNAIDLAAGFADPSTSNQTALQLVSQAFDEIDRKNDGSLTVEDLQAAGERAQVKPSGLSLLQQIWLTISGTANGFRLN